MRIDMRLCGPYPGRRAFRFVKRNAVATIYLFAPVCFAGIFFAWISLARNSWSSHCKAHGLKPVPLVALL